MLEIHRLNLVAYSPKLRRLGAIPGMDRARQDNHRNLSRKIWLGLEPFEHLQASHFGHLEIQEHQRRQRVLLTVIVWCLAPQIFYGLLAVFQVNDPLLDPCTFQGALSDQCVLRAIFHQQHNCIVVGHSIYLNLMDYTNLQWHIHAVGLYPIRQSRACPRRLLSHTSFAIILTLGKAHLLSPVNSMTLNATDSLARTLIQTIRAGDTQALARIIGENPGIAAARIKERGGSRTPLHVVTDWPGFFPNGPAVVKTLIPAGANPNVGTEGDNFSETPLHWTASNDDVEVAQALIEGGADLELRGGSIAGGTALENAIGYGCWRVARLLVEHGATIEKLWHAAALGMTSRVKDFFDEPTPPSLEELNNAFWQACHGGYRRTAEYLFARGADLNWVPDYAKQTPLEIASGGGLDTGRQALVNWLRERGDKSKIEH